MHKFWPISNYSVALTACNGDADFLNDPNTFSGRFEALSNNPAVKTVRPQPPPTAPPQVSEGTLPQHCGHVAVPEGSRRLEKPQVQNTPGRVLTESAEQLVCALKDIFTTSPKFQHQWWAS